MTQFAVRILTMLLFDPNPSPACASRRENFFYPTPTQCLYVCARVCVWVCMFSSASRLSMCFIPRQFYPIRSCYLLILVIVIIAPCRCTSGSTRSHLCRNAAEPIYAVNWLKLTQKRTGGLLYFEVTNMDRPYCTIIIGLFMSFIFILSIHVHLCISLCFLDECLYLYIYVCL